MSCATEIDPDWISALALQHGDDDESGSSGGAADEGGSENGAMQVHHPLLKLSAPLESPGPAYDAQCDRVVCYVTPRFGCDGWRLRPVPVPLKDAASPEVTVRWFARLLLEGRVLDGKLRVDAKRKKKRKKKKRDRGIPGGHDDDDSADDHSDGSADDAENNKSSTALLGPHMLTDPPALLTVLQKPSKKVLMLVSSLLRPPAMSSRGSANNSRVATAEGGSNDDEPVTSLRALQARLRLNPSAFSSALRLWLRQEDALDAERLEARGGLLGAVLKAILRA